MKGSDYHRWWKASRIGLGYPLEAENYQEMTEKLSPAGAAIVIAIHLIPDVTSCEKDYLISDLGADYGARWAAALRVIGANRLAEFVESSIGVDHLSRIAEGVSEDDFAAALQSGKSIFYCQQVASEMYFDSFDFETKTELETLVDQFAIAHDAELRSDMAQHGEGDASDDLEADWSDAVDEKHTRQDQDRTRNELESRSQQWQSSVEKAIKVFPTGDVDAGLVQSLTEAYRELQRFPLAQLGPESARIKSKIAELIATYRSLFSRDVRPDRDKLQSADCLRRLQESFSSVDIEWVQSIGAPTIVSISSSVLGRADASDVSIDFASVRGINWEWISPGLSLRLEDLPNPLEIPDNVRTSVDTFLRRDHSVLSRQLADALLTDFRERFLPELSTGQFRIYKPDVTDDEILADVEGLLIVITRPSYAPKHVRTVFCFGVEWDSEHGVCLEETRSGQFELSEV